MKTEGLIVFPAHALLIVEERLQERQEVGELPVDMDVTDFAIRLLGSPLRAMSRVVLPCPPAPLEIPESGGLLSRGCCCYPCSTLLGRGGAAKVPNGQRYP
jgi:hypothetical protein